MQEILRKMHTIYSQCNLRILCELGAKIKLIENDSQIKATRLEKTFKETRDFIANFLKFRLQ